MLLVQLDLVTPVLLEESSPSPPRRENHLAAFGEDEHLGKEGRPQKTEAGGRYPQDEVAQANDCN